MGKKSEEEPIYFTGEMVGVYITLRKMYSAKQGVWKIDLPVDV